MKPTVIIVGFAAVFCCTAFGLFVPEDSQENTLVRALLNGYSETNIYSRITNHGRGRSRRSPGQVQGNHDINDYMSALQGHHSMQQDDNEKGGILFATEHLGSCAAMYQNVLESWGHFFNKRKFQARAVIPIHQFTNGEESVASFGRFSLSGYAPDDVQAADFIVSLSSATDQVVYGRYHFQVSSTRDLQLHDDQQATCGTDEDLYFVLGLNEDGREVIRNWMNGKNETIELSLRAQTMRQISRSTNESFISSHIDIGAKIEAIILHLKVSGPQPFPDSLLPKFPTRRRKRRGARRTWTPGPNDCRLKRYTMDYTDSRTVIKPKIVDIGICEGSCLEGRKTEAHTPLNVTIHTVLMLKNQFYGYQEPGNPDPKACCFPNAYKDFYFLSVDYLDNLFVDHAVEMIATRCSCR